MFCFVIGCVLGIFVPHLPSTFRSLIIHSILHQSPSSTYESSPPLMISLYSTPSTTYSSPHHHPLQPLLTFHSPSLIISTIITINTIITRSPRLPHHVHCHVLAGFHFHAWMLNVSKKFIIFATHSLPLLLFSLTFSSLLLLSPSFIPSSSLPLPCYLF